MSETMDADATVGVEEEKKDEKKEEKKEETATLGKLSAYSMAGVLGSFLSVEFKASTAIIVGRFSRAIQTELRDRDKVLEDLRKKYGVKADGENGETWSVVPPSKGGDAEKWSEFRSEAVDLDGAEVDLSAFSFRTADFKNAKGNEAEISGGVIQMLLDLGIFKE